MPPLTIAVLGAGGIGSAFAYHLARAGHAVTLIARPGSKRLEQLQRDGGLVRDTGERAEVRVTAELDDQEYDLVLVTTLAHQVDAVLPALRRSRARAVQFMFNTFEPERLKSAMGARGCSFGMPILMARVDREGRLHTALHPGQKTLHGDGRWAALFVEAGIPSALEPDMPRWLRGHVPVCLSFESISVAGQRRGGGASWIEAMVVARGMQGAFTILKRLDGRIYPSAKSMMSSCPTSLIALMLWSVSRITSFRELLATGAGECRALADRVALAASALTPPEDRAVEAVLAMKPSEERSPS